MRKARLAAAAAALVALGTAGTAGASELEPNPGNPANAEPSANCIAIFSSALIHNGSAISTRASHGQRGTEIKLLQALCNNANEKP